MNTKYTEEQIEWALGELRKKDPKWATREQAIKLLNKFGELGNSVVDKIKKDKKLGKLTSKN